jgi:hypothetical protein
MNPERLGYLFELADCGDIRLLSSATVYFQSNGDTSP